MAKVNLIVIRLDDRPGALADAITALAQAGVNITSVLGLGPQGVVQLAVDNARKAKKALDGAGVPYSESRGDAVELSNRPGALLQHLRKLAKKGVNLRSICATTTKGGKKATVVWSTE